MKQEKKETSDITTQICFVILFGSLFLSVAFSWEANHEIKTLNEKIQIRDTIYMKLLHHNDRMDSIAYHHLYELINYNEYGKIQVNSNALPRR